MSGPSAASKRLRKMFCLDFLGLRVYRSLIFLTLINPYYHLLEQSHRGTRGGNRIKMF